MKKYLSFRLVLLMNIVLAIGCSSKTDAQPQLTFTPYINNISAAVDIKNAGDGSNRLFIVQQSGEIRIFKNGALLSTPFLNMSNLVKYASEQGLLSIAFPPNYKQAGYFFIYYNARNENVTLARYKVSTSNPDVADPSSGVILFSYPKPGGFGNHNGGCLQFGKDGYLYSSIGDGGSGGDPFNNAQNLASPFGKIHRLDVRKLTAPYYKVPADNPFINTANAVKTIWAYGLRNTWRWSFDRQTGDVWLGDVGQDLWEEVDFSTPQQAGGANYGWRCYEGNNTYNTDSCRGKRNYRFPIFSYPHNLDTGGLSVIGGYVYRGNAFPALKGYYVCADYLSSNAWKIISNGSGGWNIYLQKNVPASIVSFGEDEQGELYAASFNGTIYKVGATATAIKANEQAGNTNAIKNNYIFPTVVTNGKINIVMKDNFSRVRILNVSGQQIMQQQLAAQVRTFTLSLPHLTAGMYLLELAGKTTEKFKFFIQ
ncbi:T9SS type A sorting domain-containing protein [Panacibacter ginsenosidivorans]|uniref:T9SS type A sorting domain-containing protein n=1 Tax=Panacibacter ginsenosidivorans TaxID=1813871 RepID=A0A5B8V8V8_9BACT|nr:PQQ-dependent sugar dehydrogenase [Panacibacter ginsenosidivorans]QEC67281.1 T9SS type A sorting domain-containing protein [Panacibacter ginsenosidivorans]